MPPKTSHFNHAQRHRPYTIGGTQADAPNHLERRQIDKLLRERGLRAEHGYAYIRGDCGFNSLSYLTGENALAIRSMAMQLFGPHIIACTDTDELEAFNISTVGHMRVGMTPEDYVRAMQVSATEGGLWADPIALDWAGKAMHATIEVFCLAITRTETGERVRLDSQTYGAMTFDPVRGEPKVLRLLFTGPVTAGHYTPITKLVARPSLKRPGLPPSMHWEPQQEQFCLLHAFNQLVGQKTATPDRLISWFQKQQISPTYPHHQGTFNNQDNDIFNPRTGNFNPNAFALWVFETHRLNVINIPELWLDKPGRNQPRLPAPSLMDLIDKTFKAWRARGYAYNGFTVRSLEPGGYWHASTVLYHSQDSTWYWLDSEAPGRANLSGPAGAENREALSQVARQFFGLAKARSLADCNFASMLFPQHPRVSPGTEHPIDTTIDSPDAGLPRARPPPSPPRMARTVNQLQQPLVPPSSGNTTAHTPHPEVCAVQPADRQYQPSKQKETPGLQIN